MTYTNIDHKSSLFLNVIFNNQAPDMYGVHMYQDFSVIFNYETLSRSSFNVTPKTKFAELRGIGMTIRRRRRWRTVFYEAFYFRRKKSLVNYTLEAHIVSNEVSVSHMYIVLNLIGLVEHLNFLTYKIVTYFKLSEDHIMYMGPWWCLHDC